VVSIKESSAGSPDALRYYYFFYDWEIKTPDCNSELSTVSITLGGDAGIQENVLSRVGILPNPTTGKLQIINYEGGEIEIYNVVGQTLMTLRTLGTIETIDVSHLAKGMYFLKIGNKVVRFGKE
jgi:hypothetical protein